MITRSRRGGLAVGLGLLVAGCGGESPEGDATAPADPRIAQVENGLRLAVAVDGDDPTFSIGERLERYAVPGMAVAVVSEGAVAWARGYGVADTETHAAVTDETLFQAASISKPVSALAALSLVEDGTLDLDAPINEALATWEVPDNAFTGDSSVTLRGLLTHSAGLTVWGFPGYARGQPIPSNVEVLDGAGNTDPVRVYKTPGESWQYSGGGYTVMEQALEDVSGTDFAALLSERVLTPAGMTRSTFVQPLPEERWSEAARGHRGDGSEVEGEWHTYPEQAAAGLWTTPEDLARLSAHLIAILDGSVSDGVVRRETLEQMLTPHGGGADRYASVGLSFGLAGEGVGRSFGHGGANEGFRAIWTTFPKQRAAVAVMTNGDQGSALAQEVVRAVVEAYGWEGPERVRRVRSHPDPAVLAGLAGSYDVEGTDLVVQIEAGDDVLVFRAGGSVGELLAESDLIWFDPEDGQVVTFERDDAGAVVGASTSNGFRMIRR